jgi:hypothetical protein
VTQASRANRAALNPGAKSTELETNYGSSATSVSDAVERLMAATKPVAV